MRRVALGLLLVASPALADGPHIALHASQGAYTATLFSAPDPLVAGKVEFVLLVTQGEGGPAVPVREAGLALKPENGDPVLLSLRTENGEAAGTAVLARSGHYAMTVSFSPDPSHVVRLYGTLPVAPNHGRRDAVLWSVLAPLSVVLLFLANQAAKQKLRAPKP